ncbi:MAG: methylmalonyl Co-A mutase-associated GTPase MeaB [Pseudomonadota bacterium]
MRMDELVTRVASGDRRALARAITLIESGRDDHRAQAHALIDQLRSLGREALRIGLSGAPGVGKSTFIEAFGAHITEQGLNVAVLAVDPSSTRSGGSILGDKTRMAELARNPRAYIRPSPSQAALGGVARRTREAVIICEAAGFDVVLIETVGVGQSEVLVAGMTDIFGLLIAPGGGDELQGVKRGIMEIADLVLVNKADGELAGAAHRTVAEYTGALRLLRARAQDPEGYPKVLSVSAQKATGIKDVFDEMTTLADWRNEQGYWVSRRAAQARDWFEEEVREGLLARLSRAPELAVTLDRLGEDVARGQRSPAAAAAELLSRLP